MQQVLIKLPVNAIQAMPEGGTLSLEADDGDVADAASRYPSADHST